MFYLQSIPTSGVQANEVHVCGEPAAEHVLKALIKSTGDDLEVSWVLSVRWDTFGMGC